MFIHHALYGPKHGGHALLASSDESLNGTFRAVAWATDLPSTVPNGISWKSYLRTVCADKFYILIHTRPNEAAGRGGMVSSRAAFLPLETLHQVKDLRAVAAKLIAEEGTENLRPFALDYAAPNRGVELNKLTYSIANRVASKAKFPVVVAGQDGFDDAMLDLWLAAPPELRSAVIFGLSFGPDDTTDRQLIAVSTPHEMIGRWTGYLVANADEHGISETAAILLNEAHGPAVRALAAEMGMKLGTLEDLHLAQYAHSLWESAQSAEDHIAFVRLLTAKKFVVSLDSKLRAEALRKITAQATDWSTADVLSMRNLNLADFSSAGMLWNEVAEWTKRLERHAKHNYVDVGRLIADAVRGNAVPEWYTTILDAAHQAFIAIHVPSADLVKAVWNAMTICPTHTLGILKLLGSTSTSDALGRIGPSQLEQNIAEQVAKAAAQRGRWDVVGTALGATQDLIWAAQRILSLQPPAAAAAVAMKNIFDQAEPVELIRATLAVDHPSLVALAGEVCARKPGLLVDFDWYNPLWFDILVAAQRYEAETFARIPDYASQLDSLLASGGDAQHVRSWAAIGQTPLGDISMLSNRAIAWEIIPASVQAPILQRTADAWLTRFQHSTESMPLPEKPLVDAIRSNASVSVLIGMALENPTTFVRYVDAVFAGSDADACTIVERTSSELPANWLDFSAASKLGVIIAERRWGQTASMTARLASVRRDFIPTAQACQELLNIFERFGLLMIGAQMYITDDEAWEILESEAVALYPTGPADQEVWSRSSGKNADLPKDLTGRAQWHRCLKDLRAGKGPAPRKLIRTMLEDFSRNPTLIQLQNRF